jgi:hypothetical protein
MEYATPQSKTPPSTPWKRNINEYPTLHAFQFASPGEFAQALEVLVIVPELKGVPVLPLGSQKLVVPDTAVDPWGKALTIQGISFEESCVRKASEFAGPRVHVQRSNDAWTVR